MRQITVGQLALAIEVRLNGLLEGVDPIIVIGALRRLADTMEAKSAGHDSYIGCVTIEEDTLFDLGEVNVDEVVQNLIATLPKTEERVREFQEMKKIPLEKLQREVRA